MIDLDAFEERAAIIEFDGGLSRFEAETLAAEAQGVTRWQAMEALNAERNGNPQSAGHQGSQPARQPADDMPRVQPAPKEETRSVSQRDVQAGRDRLALLALRSQRRAVV